ncbi:MAG: flavoredoxin [Deltaproteobacteria bacterium RBG_13_43_22]|nr:MAG: flavoredoxin [Deltaproteobacteria bacterium RBG_13_43_22]
MKKSIGAKTIVYPTPVFVVGTYDQEGRPNVMTAAWGGICCSAPPCVAIALREATYSYGNLMAQKAFTISLPSESYIKEADYFGMASGKNEEKFTVTGLTPIKSELVNAPYVKEFPFVLECKVIHHYKIGLHTQFIGEILDIKVEEEVLSEKGADITKIKPVLWAPDSRGYYGIGRFLGKAFSLGKDLLQEKTN